jgi:hypothetical protein
MSVQDHQGQEQTAIRTDLGAIFVSMELSRSSWLITSLSPGAGEKMSKHAVAAADIAGLFERFAETSCAPSVRRTRYKLDPGTSALDGWDGAPTPSAQGRAKAGEARKHHRPGRRLGDAPDRRRAQRHIGEQIT